MTKFRIGDEVTILRHDTHECVVGKTGKVVEVFKQLATNPFENIDPYARQYSVRVNDGLYGIFTIPEEDLDYYGRSAIGRHEEDDNITISVTLKREDLLSYIKTHDISILELAYNKAFLNHMAKEGLI